VFGAFQLYGNNIRFGAPAVEVDSDGSLQLLHENETDNRDLDLNGSLKVLE